MKLASKIGDSKTVSRELDIHGNDTGSQTSKRSYPYPSEVWVSFIFSRVLESTIPPQAVIDGHRMIVLIQIAKREMHGASFCGKGSQSHNDRNLASEPTVFRYFYKFHTSQLKSINACLTSRIDRRSMRKICIPLATSPLLSRQCCYSPYANLMSIVQCCYSLSANLMLGLKLYSVLAGLIACSSALQVLRIAPKSLWTAVFILNNPLSTNHILR